MLNWKVPSSPNILQTCTKRIISILLPLLCSAVCYNNPNIFSVYTDPFLPTLLHSTQKQSQPKRLNCPCSFVISGSAFPTTTHCLGIDVRNRRNRWNCLVGFEEGLNSETGSEEFRAFVLGWESICTWAPDGFVLKFLLGSWLSLFFIVSVFKFEMVLREFGFLIHWLFGILCFDEHAELFYFRWFWTTGWSKPVVHSLYTNVFAFDFGRLW